VGYHLSPDLGISGCLQALQDAIKSCSHPAGIVHHSDRGIQYCSHPYRALLHQHGLRISMTEENHCYENALAERVNGILKDEYLLDATFTDYRQAAQACREAVRLYNTRRPHWALNFKTPDTGRRKKFPPPACRPEGENCQQEIKRNQNTIKNTQKMNKNLTEKQVLTSTFFRT
jgi:transposase InsO family protein